jgi:hypothetical protein
MLIGSVLGHRAVSLAKANIAPQNSRCGAGVKRFAANCILRHIDVIMLSPSTTQSEFFERLIDTPANQSGTRAFGSMPAHQSCARRSNWHLQRNSRDIILERQRSRTGVGRSLFFPAILDRILWTYGQPDSPK